NNLTVTADGRPCRVMYIGHPAADGITQVNVTPPEGIRTGLIPVELTPAAAWFRMIPAGPAVPRVAAVTDGINLLSPNRVSSRIVKIAMRDVAHPDEFRASVDGAPVKNVDSFCTDQTKQTYEFNFTLPDCVAAGWHHICLALGRREFAPIPIEVV